MSTDLTLVPARETPGGGKTGLFGELLVERYKRAGESQRDVAEWLTSWMMTHDLDRELAEIERTCSDDEIDDTKDAIAVIRAHMATNDVAGEREVTQGAISKWRKGGGAPGGGRPSAAKWVALARYMGLPLGDTYRLVVFMEYPKSMVALQQQLASAMKDNEQLRRDYDAVRADLARAERAVRETNEELLAMKLRLDALDAAGVGAVAV